MKEYKVDKNHRYKGIYKNKITGIQFPYYTRGQVKRRQDSHDFFIQGICGDCLGKEQVGIIEADGRKIEAYANYKIKPFHEKICGYVRCEGEFYFVLIQNVFMQRMLVLGGILLVLVVLAILTL